jgi:hypothetical protein
MAIEHQFNRRVSRSGLSSRYEVFVDRENIARDLFPNFGAHCYNQGICSLITSGNWLRQQFSNRQYLRVKDRHSLVNRVVHVINDDDQTLEHKDHQQLNAKAGQPGCRQHHQHKVQVGDAAQPGVEGGVVADLCFG